ncbi:MAG: hypothetical protein CML24_09465 [Rhizobiales bacterium]|jgi:hypothetical protein|nr:hypothetical protein [Hyphomicrobiales bacterium]|tara:strand:- start:5773 stop:5988 length:216 start_codon:yes stop_codon:yes gene_type:complete
MENPLRVAVLDQARSFAQQTMRKSIIWTAEKLSSTGAKHDREPMKRLLGKAGRKGNATRYEKSRPGPSVKK